MEMLKDRLYAQERVIGTWCNLGSPLSAELAGITGYDWVLLDQEHGPGDNITLLHQLHALGEVPHCSHCAHRMEGSYPYQTGAGSGGRGHYVPVYSECGRGAGGRGFHAVCSTWRTRACGRDSVRRLRSLFWRISGKHRAFPALRGADRIPRSRGKTPQPSPPCRGWMSCSSARSI